jgi:hypothetical protein
VDFTIQDFSVGSENKDDEQPITASVSAAFGMGGYSIETVRTAKEIRLAQLESEQPKALEVDWTLGQLLGLGAALREYTRPESAFFFFGNSFFAQPPLTAAGNLVFHCDMSLGVGAYMFFPPDSPVRSGVSTVISSNRISKDAATIYFTSVTELAMLNTIISDNGETRD